MRYRINMATSQRGQVMAPTIVLGASECKCDSRRDILTPRFCRSLDDDFIIGDFVCRAFVKIGYSARRVAELGKGRRKRFRVGSAKMLLATIKIRRGDSMSHLERIADEFGRQAQTFDRWAEKADDQVAARFQAALGEVRQGNLLDVACGPGVVTAAIAPSAASVIALDATEPMLEKTKQRCANAGLLCVD